MEKPEIAVTPQAVAELRALLDANRNHGTESFIWPFRALCERHGWDWFGLESKHLFNFNAMQLAAAYERGRYCEDRLRQLCESDFTSWTFRAGPDCPEKHQQLNGIVLPPAHTFWGRYYPPLGWECGCYVIGANSNAALRRMGGDPSKQLPEWWERIDPATELRPGIEEPWGSQGAPDPLLLLAAMIDGHSPKPDFG